MNVQKLGQGLCRTMQAGYRRFRVAVAVDALLLLFLGAYTYREVYGAGGAILGEVGYASAAVAVGCIFAVSLRLFGEHRGKEDRRIEALLTALVCVFFFALVRGHTWHDPYIVLRTVGAGLTFAVFGLYCMRRGEGDHPALLVLYALCKGAVVGTLLTVSLDICLLAVDELLVSLSSRLFSTLLFLTAEVSYLFAGVQVALAGLPGPGGRAEAPPLFRALLTRVLWPVCLILLSILYLYVVKIIFRWTIPVGMMNWFASLALLTFAVFFVCFAGDARHAFLQWFLRRGLLLFLPILAVQAVAVWQRIAPYGLTAPRYASILCTLFGVFLLVCAFLRRSPRPAFLVLAIAVAVSSLTPLNILDVPLRAQEARLWRLLAENDMLQGGAVVVNPALEPDAQEKLLSAAEYLTERGRTEVLETPGMNDMLADLRGAPKGEQYVMWFSFTAPTPAVPVAGWEEAYVFAHAHAGDGVLVLQKGAGAEERCDVSACVADFLAEARMLEARTGSTIFTREMLIDLDDHTRLCMSDLKLSVHGSAGGEFVTADMNGVLLKR